MAVNYTPTPPANGASRATKEVELWTDDADTKADIDSRLDTLEADTTASDHISDTTDAHDASAVSIADAGAYFTGTDVEAALQELGAAGPGAVVASTRVYRSAALNIATGGSGTVINMDAESYDDGGWHDLVTNPSRITVPSNGLYLLQACCSMLQAATGERQGQILVNGTFRAVGRIVGTASAHATIHVQTTLRLSASDYVELLGYQTSGANLALNTGTGETWLAVTRLGD